MSKLIFNIKSLVISDVLRLYQAVNSKADQLLIRYENMIKSLGLMF